MWYFLTMYSFDNSKLVRGPFTTEEAAWSAMLKDAEVERDSSARDFPNRETNFYTDRDSGEIRLEEITGYAFSDDEFPDINADRTTWILFHIN